MARLRAGKMKTATNFPMPEAVDAAWPDAPHTRRRNDDLASLRSSSSLSWISNSGSLSSMSWMEDDLERESTQQVQALWNLVEDFLYEGRPLMEAQGLETELNDWSERFPHLRLMGVRMRLGPRPSSLKEDPEDIPGNEEVFASHGKTDTNATLLASRHLDSHEHRLEVSVAKVAEILSDALWERITDKLRDVLDLYVARVSEPMTSVGSNHGPNLIVPRVGPLNSVSEEELELVDTDGSENGTATPTGFFSPLSVRGVSRRKSVPHDQTFSKFSPEPSYGSEPHLEAVRKIDKKVQRLSRQKSKSSPADVIELRAYTSSSISKSEKQVKFKLPASLGQSGASSSTTSRASSGNSVGERRLKMNSLHLPPVPVNVDKSPSRVTPFDVYARARSATAHNGDVTNVRRNPRLDYRPSTAAVAPIVPARFPNLSRGSKKILNMRLKLEPLQKSKQIDADAPFRFADERKFLSDVGSSRKS